MARTAFGTPSTSCFPWPLGRCLLVASIHDLLAGLLGSEVAVGETILNIVFATSGSEMSPGLLKAALWALRVWWVACGAYFLLSATKESGFTLKGLALGPHPTTVMACSDWNSSPMLTVSHRLAWPVSQSLFGCRFWRSWQTSCQADLVSACVCVCMP